MPGSNNKNQEKTIIFLHIPKAAGTTIYSILKNQYNDTESYQLDGSRTPQAAEEFKQLPQERKNKIRLLYGHMGFGLHRQFSCKTSYFTLLREPIDRIISHYYFVLRTPHHYLYEEVLKNKMNLKEYVASGISKELNDSQVRFIVDGGFRFEFNQCPHHLLDLSKNILDEFFVVVGLKEFFDETMLMLRKALNWKLPPVYIKQNITKTRLKKEDLDNDTIETIKKYNRLDLALYHYAAANFNEKIKSFGNLFQSELKAFKILNTHWQQFWNVNKLKNKIPQKNNQLIVEDITNRVETLLSDGDEETARCLVKDAIELYPGKEKLKNFFDSFSKSIIIEKNSLSKEIRNKKLAIVDHSFHQTSGATSFLIDLLEKHFEVKVFWDESWQGKACTNLEEIADQGYDTIVLFQETGYAEEKVKITANKNLILVPMFDDSFTKPFESWEKFKHVKMINFSKRFHKKIKKFGLISRYFQYFPSPHDSSPPGGGQRKLSGLFWQRTDRITWNHIKELIKNTNFNKIHIHTAVDPPGFPVILPSTSEIKKYNITISQWFPEKEDYLSILDDAAVYFAPRLFEGIGMSFLEAMARGKCVVAPDNSTMNEYIIHGKTGLLYDPGNPKPLDFSNIKEIGENARKYIEQGHQRWIEAQKELIDFIHQSPVQPITYKYLTRKTLAFIKRKMKQNFPTLDRVLLKIRKFSGRKQLKRSR
jgi:glycosyltransferase involved in cell wall biosynthesis